jgi:methylthioribulose-1-phosphate dehydratase
MPLVPAGLARDLASLARRFHTRGWAPGTGGNYSAVISARPLRLAVTASSLEKRTCRSTDVLQVDERGNVVGSRRGTPSAETLLHIEIVRRRGARAVLHTHSVWNTMLSDVHAERGGFDIEGYEMLKALHGVTTHEHREHVPIVENDQDIPRLAKRLGAALDREPGTHAILLRRHGMYTWGETLAEAERHVETLEFLFETIGRTPTARATEADHGIAQDS